ASNPPDGPPASAESLRSREAFVATGSAAITRMSVVLQAGHVPPPQSPPGDGAAVNASTMPPPSGRERAAERFPRAQRSLPQILPAAPQLRNQHLPLKGA